ncbi:hypothetical protein L5G28_18560 [Gordonia sp. HY285]|uniref:hypothetical protein n=1 Tax=Gordonia liuliyuniae TaxID=2911517 RepID=UPI001F4573C2|nr:hypothetical protein [Gordonia liuliyuniae]MCF8612149.1 hypothetical protein [Gordonia liuliyuniae]
MRTAVRLILAVLMVVVAVGATSTSPGSACACSCLPLTADEVSADAGAIVQGRAVGVSERGLDRVYEFEVDASYKTRVHERIEIATSSSSASCGVELEIGQPRTLALARGTPIGGDPAAVQTEWAASLCSNISRLGATAMPASAGPRLEPLAGTAQASGLPDASGAETANDAGSGSRSWWIVTLVVLAGVVVVGGGVVIAARQSRR